MPSPPDPDRPTNERVSFSFGKNWQRYLDEMPEDATSRMEAYVREWLGPDVSGLRVVDIGSGQGLTSLTLFRMGADVLSMDIDPASVAATTSLWQAAGSPQRWQVEHRSILDPSIATDLGTFDVVVSWGVLHHTGAIWTAIDNAAALVADGGRLWIALYHRTPHSGRSLRTKRLYNRLPAPGQRAFRGGYAIAKYAKNTIKQRGIPDLRKYASERGMNWWRDIEDWLGGLPYEVSSPGEVLARIRPAGFELVKLRDGIGEGGNDVYLFARNGARE